MSIDEIKKLLKTEDLILGSEVTLSALRNNELVKVFLASNALKETADEIVHLAGLLKVDVKRLSIPNDELGMVCKKPFSVACIGVRKIVKKKKY